MRHKVRIIINDMEILTKIIICLMAGAGIGTGVAGMSAAAIIGPMLAETASQDTF